MDRFTLGDTTFVGAALWRRCWMGDDVSLRCSEANKPSYIAKIDGLRNRAGFLEIKADWYYRPEDVVGGRRPFHGAREVFPSDHSDWQPAESVEGHIRVLPLESHLTLPERTADDFFTRFTYESVRQRFRPARVPVFCLCAQPWNPDVPMLLCSRCAEFYHAGCVPNPPTEGLGPGRTPAAFVCSECILSG